MKPKLCYVMPNFSGHTHFAYAEDFLPKLSRFFDLAVIIESGETPRSIKGLENVYIQKFNLLPLRLIENFILLLWVRSRGYCKTYVHYSFISAFNSSVISRITGGRTFYWNCGLPWLYKRNFMREFFERSVYRAVNFLVTGTENLRMEYAGHYNILPDKILVMPNWIDLDKIGNPKSKTENSDLRKKAGVPADRKILLFVHRLSKRKGAHLIPRILSGLKNTGAFLLIVGDGPERGFLEAELRKMHLYDSVKFFGWISNEHLGDYFQMTDAFLLPSEEEGFPHVLLESLAYGVLPVAFNVGGVPEVLPPDMSGNIARAGDVEEFSGIVRRILSLPEKERKDLEDMGRKWVSKFSLPVALENFRNVLNQE